MSVELVLPMGTGELPFTAEGEAVDESAICPAGMMTVPRLEDVAGTEIDDAIWSDMWDSAMEDEAVAELNVFSEWVCEDDSGTFEFALHNRFDFSTLEFEGQQDVGTWEITGGTGDYDGLEGSGDVVLDFDAGEASHIGEVTKA